jgi:hypothetical protein
MTEERKAFRYVVGIIAVLGGLGGLAALFFVEVPEGNREPMLLALGLVLGWGSTVISYEFGSSPAGRRAADAGVKLAEHAPLDVVVQNPTSNPVPTETADEHGGAWPVGGDR